MRTLTVKQMRAADALREIRPAVLPGTNVIPDEKKRQQWSDLVVTVMEWNEIKTAEQTKLFCNRAGVPD